MVRLKYNHWLFKLPLLRKYRAICLGRTIYFKGDPKSITPRLMRHEMVHQEQIEKNGLTRFYTLYLLHYFKNLMRYRNHGEAYRKIDFEAEAYRRESEGEA